MARRYVELSYTLPSNVVEAITSDEQKPLDSQGIGVFRDHGGITVVVPCIDLTYQGVISLAMALAVERLELLIADDVIIPVPWRITIVDIDLMAENLRHPSYYDPAPVTSNAA